MSTMPISGPMNEPHPEQYTARDLGMQHEQHGDRVVSNAHDVIAAQELLEWMRFRGYRAQSIIVGKVQIVGLIDDYARATRRSGAPPTERDPLLPWGD